MLSLSHSSHSSDSLTSNSSGRKPLLASSKASARRPDPVPLQAPGNRQAAAHTIAQTHAQHAHPAPPLAPGTQSLVLQAQPLTKPGEQPADIRYTLDHHPGLTARDRTMAYGLWCLVTVTRTILAGVGGSTSEASPFLALMSSAGSIYDAASGVGDHGIAKDKYLKAQQVHEDALAHWRQLARQVDSQPLDEASEQMLTASRHLVVLLTQILDGFEANYFPIAKANRLKAQRDLSLAAEDKWLERQRVADAPDNAARRAQLSQELKDILERLQALPQASGVKHRDLERLQRQLQARAKRIRRLEDKGPLTPAEHAELLNLRQDQARQKEELKRLKPFFTKVQGPAAFLNTSDIGLRQLCLLRDAGINKVMQPMTLSLLVTNLFLHHLPSVPHIAVQGAGTVGAGLNVLGAGANMVYSHYDMEFADRALKTARKQDRKALQDLGSMVELKRGLSRPCDEDAIGQYLAENRIKSLLKAHKQHKRDKLFFSWRSFRSQFTFFTLAPASFVVGGVALGLYIVGNVVTAGTLGIATAVVGGVSLAALLAAVTWRCWLGKRNKDEDRLKLRAMRHVQAVLGADGLHGLYTLSEPEFNRRMQPVLESAPPALRKELRRQRLLKDNKFVAVEWCSRELLRGAQKAEREQGPAPDSWARQMLLKLGMSAADVGYLQTCRPLCTDDDHYLQTCRQTIAAQLYNGTLYPDKRLPHHQPSTGLEASGQILLDLLKSPAHKALSEQLRGATSHDALLPQTARDTQARQAQEERLAQLRAGLLRGGVGPKDLVELRNAFNGSDPEVWLLDALIDPDQRGQAPNPLKAPSQAIVVRTPVLSYEMLDRAIKWVGRQNEPEVVQYFKGNAPTPNPMGTARQFLKMCKHRPGLNDQLLKTLTDWKRSELQKLDGQPTVPPGYPSMDAWVLAAMRDIAKQCDRCNESLQIVNEKGERRGQKLQRRFVDWQITARVLEQHQLGKMSAAAA